MKRNLGKLPIWFTNETCGIFRSTKRKVNYDNRLKQATILANKTKTARIGRNFSVISVPKIFRLGLLSSPQAYQQYDRKNYGKNL